MSKNVSVIIPVLNERDQIADSIQSALVAGAQEVIVVDGGSTDGSIEEIETFDCKLIHGQAGRGRQLRLGCLDAAGDWLLFLHADSQLSPLSIQQIHKRVDRFPSTTHGCFRQQIDQTNLILRLIERGNEFRARCFKMMYGDQAIFLRKDIYQQINGVPDVKIMEDVILSDRLKKIGRPQILPGPIKVNSRRWQKNGAIRQTLFNWMCFWKYRMGFSIESIASQYESYS